MAVEVIHQPVELVVVRRARSANDIYTKDGKWAFSVYGPHFDEDGKLSLNFPTDEEREANTRLVLALPHMVQALRQARDVLRDVAFGPGADRSDVFDALARVAFALREAVGEEDS